MQKRTKLVAATILATGGLLFILFSLQANKIPKCEYEKQLSELEQFYAIHLTFSEDTEALPQEWRDAPFNGRASGVSLEHACAALPSIIDELKLYPTDVIKRLLDEIVLFQSLEFYGTAFGGTAYKRSLFLVVNSANTPDQLTTRRLFHHELSSLFLYAHSFSLDKWQAANPNGFEYETSLSDRLKSIKNGLGDTENQRLYAEGFLTEYSKTSFEDDFNLYAEYYFAMPEKFQKLTQQYPAINSKYQLFKEHYLSVSKEFNFSF